MPWVCLADQGPNVICFRASLIPFGVTDPGQTVTTAILVGTYVPIALAWALLAICNLGWDHDLDRMCFSMYVHKVGLPANFHVQSSMHHYELGSCT